MERLRSFRQIAELNVLSILVIDEDWGALKEYERRNDHGIR